MRWVKLSNSRFALWDGWALLGDVRSDPDGLVDAALVIPRGRNDRHDGSWKPGPRFATMELAKKWVEDEVKLAEIRELA